MTAAVRNRGEWRPAAVLPVVRVAVDVSLAHLDRPFDYRVPEHLDDVVTAGVRVRVRFAGRLVDGFALERVAESDHAGRLAWVEKVVSPEPALTPGIAALCRAVADRYGGVLADVLRLAVPPRHARVERERVGPPPVMGPVPDPPGSPDGAGGSEPAPAPVPAEPQRAAAPAGWERYRRGSALLAALGAGRAAHAVWQALPGEDWAARLAEAAATTARSGRGALLVVPDQRDVDALAAACAARVGPDAVAALTAELGPAERYRRWLAVRRGRARIVVGTRSAAFAPLAEPGLLVIWDDGDDLHAEPRAPYPHARDVLVTRAHQAGAAVLVGGFARTAEGQLLVDSGWASEVLADRAVVRAAMPRVVVPGDSDAQLARDPLARAARLPAVAFEAARAALEAGRPVLVQVPRAGYVPWLACARCRESARCRHCVGPLGLPRAPGAAAEPGDDAGAGGAGKGWAGGDAVRAADDATAALPRCRWCGRSEAAFRCGACGGRRLRAAAVGSGRTAEELGRAFPGTRVLASGGGSPVLAEVADRPEIVVATPGAEPRAGGGWGAALLLDGWALLARPDLRVAEETLRRWMAAAGQVVPHGDGGRVVVMADPAAAPVQALVRWDPVWHATAELAARAEVGFPPAVRMAAVEGSPAAVAEILAALPRGAVPDPAVPDPAVPDPAVPDPAVPDPAVPGPADPDGAPVEVLGPVELPPGSDGERRERMLLRVPRDRGRALASALHAAQAARSARRAPDPARVRLDPLDVG